MEDKLVKYRPLFIGGEWVDPAEGETDEDINPATGEGIARVAVAGKEDVDRAVTAAQKAYDEVWFDTPPKERAGMLLKLADAIDANAAEFARLESIDVGKPISLSQGDIPFISDNLRFFAGAARCQEGKSTGEYERGFTSMIRREPLGVTVGICPWNYPLMMAVWKIGPALAAGNTSIIKPAQITPLTTLYLAELA
ncbi:MAG: aldehyde dehydrogenase family protein, partial [Acidimicrobiales bacterium]